MTILQRTAGGAWTPVFSGGSQFGIGTSTEKLVSPYEQEAWIYACMRLAADCVKQAPLRFYDRDPELDPEGAKEITSGPIVELFQRVNPLLDPQSLVEMDVLHMDLTGESFWFMCDKNGEPVHCNTGQPDSFIDLPHEIWPVRGDIVRLTRDERTGMPKHWTVPMGSGKPVDFEPGAVVQHMYRNPGSPLRGLGPAAAALGQAAQNYIALRYQNSVLEKGGDMGGVLSFKGTLDPDEYERLQQQVKDKQESGRAGEMLILEGDASYAAVPVGAKVLAYGDLLTCNRKVIAGVFRTPEALIGLDADNYAAFQGHFKAYFTLKTIPWFTQRASTLNSSFFPRLKDSRLRNIRCRHDLSKVDVLQGDILAQANAAKALISIGVTPNAAAKKVGITLEQPIEGGDVSIIPMGFERLDAVTAGLDGLPEDTPLATEPGTDGEGTPAIDATVETGGAAVADQALNGAQIQALIDLCLAVADGSLSKESAIGIILVGFPGIDETEARRIIDAIEVKLESDPAGDEADPATDHPLVQVEAAGKALAEIARCAPVDKRCGVTFQRALEQVLAARVPLVSVTRVDAQPAPVETRTEPEPVARVVDPYESFNRRREYGAKAAKRRRPHEQRMQSTVRRVFDQMRRAQMRVLDEFAATAPKTDATPADEIVVRGLTPSQARALAAAWPSEHRLANWKRMHARFAGVPDVELRELGWRIKARIPKAQLDALIVALRDVWIDEVRHKTSPVLESTMQDGLKDVAIELDVDMLPFASEDVIEFLKAKEIKLAEGTTSTVAQATRRAIVRTLQAHDTSGSLAQQIQAALEDVKKSVGQVYNAAATRARTIAITEVGQVQNTARDMTFQREKKAGHMKRHRWVTSGRGPEEAGGTVRHSHWQLDGNAYEIGETITTELGTRLKYAKDPNATGPDAASDIINCQCEMVPVLEPDED